MAGDDVLRHTRAAFRGYPANLRFRVTNNLFPIVETVGANIVRPGAWRGNAFPGKLLMQETGTGAHCAPLQGTFLTG